MKHPLFAVISVSFVLALSFPGARCEDLQDIIVVSGDGSKISVHADNIPLRELLSKLAETSTLNIYFAPSLSEVPVTVSFDNLPVDKAVQKLFKDFNFLAGFKREKEVDRLAMLKIYPKGTAKGLLVPVGDVNSTEEAGDMPVALREEDLSRKETHQNDSRLMPDLPEVPEQNDQTFEGPGDRRKGPVSPEVPEQNDQTFQGLPDIGKRLTSPKIPEEEQDAEANGIKVPSTPN